MKNERYLVAVSLIWAIVCPTGVASKLRGRQIHKVRRTRRRHALESPPLVKAFDFSRARCTIPTLLLSLFYTAIRR